MTDSSALLQLADDNIKPYLSVFKKICDDSIVKMAFVLDVIQEPLSKRSKASVMSDIVRNNAKKQFPVDKVKVIEKYESISLVINGVFSARFKKLNNAGLPCNVRTRRNSYVVSQLSLFGEQAEVKFIDIGYKINSAWSGFDGLKVICRNSKTILFSIPFDNIVSIPTSPTLSINQQSNSEEIKKRVNTKKKKGTDDQSKEASG